MKTNKEMQLKIIDKMRENVGNDLPLFSDIEFKDSKDGWVEIDSLEGCDFRIWDHRVKPQTITINGVDIPRPLKREEIESEHTGYGYLYFPTADPELFLIRNTAYCLNMKAERFLCYATKDEAIEASKALFGIED